METTTADDWKVNFTGDELLQQIEKTQDHDQVFVRKTLTILDISYWFYEIFAIQ